MFSQNNWFIQSFVGMLLVVPGWLAIPFFAKNFNIRGDIFLLWYVIGMGIGSIILLWKSSTPTLSIFPSFGVIMSMIVVGVVFGTLANSLVFKAVSVAPNPGLAVAIASAANAFVFVGAVLLGRLIPKYFSVITFNTFQVLGVALVLGGIILIGIKK